MVGCNMGGTEGHIHNFLGLKYDCSADTQYYCDVYSQGFNTYSQQQTQTQGSSDTTLL
jgi:hypothetical protein